MLFFLTTPPARHKKAKSNQEVVRRGGIALRKLAKI